MNEQEVHWVDVEGKGDHGDGKGKIGGTTVYIPNLDKDDERHVVITDVKDNYADASALPENPDLPFFTYGIFRRDELGYRRIQEYVSESRDRVGEWQYVEGQLIIDDGMPILTAIDNKNVEGHVVDFIESTSVDAYAEIASAEPMTHYIWKEMETSDGETVNTLNFNSRIYNSIERDKREKVVKQKKYHNTPWTTRSYFEKGLSVVQETFEDNKQLQDQYDFFRLQMGYLLLWSLIERYISLRWARPGQENYEAREDFAKKDQNFQRGFEEVFDDDHTLEYRTLLVSNDPGGRPTRISDPNDPSEVVSYLYKIRNNITHQGKGELTADGELLRRAVQDLYQTFRITLSEQYSDPEFPKIEPVIPNSERSST